MVSPLLLVLVYSVIFTQVFKSTWLRPDGTKGFFALYLFSGLTIFMIYAEVVGGSPWLVQSNANLIKRTTVGLGKLPYVNLVASLITFGFNLVPLGLLYAIFEGIPPWTIILLPLLLIPYLILVLGLSLLISSLSAYLRDLQQVIPLLNVTVQFLSPIFFAADRMPPRLRILMSINPVGPIVNASKDLLFFGRMPALRPLAIYSVIAVVTLIVGTFVYRRASRGFADVI